ncbi:very short patch repair endonuclease [Tatumella citrea]|uniref:Very short patch repair endonuclease n=1 Tax=Tatumella citrea TaxID=53336 RepID=A0A1Y0L7A3_TATCI|nr:DNA mismatch endonuclease Vsr [Tatumella citrea]ARU93906.1 very short patch repair endonuclease [Tatumella citrea]ARU97944.1 very short patch repair endonuclease [Tatumella citrea]
MADVHDPATRSKNMRAIRPQGTRIEKQLLQVLQSLGVAACQQVKELPGRPDFVIPERKKIIFTHGCFWHRHHCGLYKPPATRREFWLDKIGRNVVRDQQNLARLQEQGWTVLIIWECALKGKNRLSESQLSDRVEEWICVSELSAEIGEQGISLLNRQTIPPADQQQPEEH